MLKKAQQNNSGVSPALNFLGEGTTIEGDIQTDGDFRIDGQLNGSMNSKGKVVIGGSGRVRGDIVCQNADISGTIQAKLIVKELLILKASAVVHGDISTSKLAIEPGARFTGSCKMGEMTDEGTIPKRSYERLKKQKEAI
jgi:cytoskeletal protein CcmA (bactofilin family)